MMKRMYKVVLSFLLLVSTAYVHAQKGKTTLDVNYNVALPTGGFRTMVPSASFRGFEGSLLHGITNNFSVGLGTGFQDFYQKNARQVYHFSDGTDVSAVLTTSVQVMPILAKAKYNFNPAAGIQPYAALGIGGNIITYDQLYGEFSSQQSKFRFAARPEAGLFVPFHKGREPGFNIGASYNIMPLNDGGFNNLNHVGIHAGVRLPIGR